MKFGKKYVSIGTIRKTQLISTFATGAIAEMPEYTVMMAASNYWEGEKKFEPNLQRLLGMSYFMEPKYTESSNPMGNPDMPAFRFPLMHFCPKCGKLDVYWNFGDPKNKKCAICNRTIVPSRFIAACNNGHIEDFPFEWWVHYGNLGSCTQPDNHHKLQIKFKDNTGGLASIVIRCTACGKERSMEGSMSAKALNGYSCKGKRPWIGITKENFDPIKCNASMLALQRGASNAYYSIKQSALTIPPWSKKIQEVIEKSWEKFQTAFENDMDDSKLKMLIGFEFADLLKSGKYSVDDIFDGLMKRYGIEHEPENSFTVQKMFEEEYRALCAGEKGETEDEVQFRAEITEVSPFLEEYIDEVVLVKRLREVMAFRGFRRIDPIPPQQSDNPSEGADLDRELTPPWDKPLKWLPAVEMKGEGIFITLNEERLKEWEKLNAKRYEKMGKRIGDNSRGEFLPRYVLLHTLSHLLIRQLTVDCGYQEAALKERIYSTYTGVGSAEMAGILIYTSSSDSDGSLGGLVRQGEPDLLEETVRNLLEEASWCSSDPLCIESESQGVNALNYAACHACALLPETSCEANNCLLDRVAVVGKPDNRDLGFFGDLLTGGNDNV